MKTGQQAQQGSQDGNTNTGTNTNTGQGGGGEQGQQGGQSDDEPDAGDLAKRLELAEKENAHLKSAATAAFAKRDAVVGKLSQFEDAAHQASLKELEEKGQLREAYDRLATDNETLKAGNDALTAKFSKISDHVNANTDRLASSIPKDVLATIPQGLEPLERLTHISALAESFGKFKVSPGAARSATGQTVDLSTITDRKELDAEMKSKSPEELRAIIAAERASG